MEGSCSAVSGGEVGQVTELEGTLGWVSVNLSSTDELVVSSGSTIDGTVEGSVGIGGLVLILDLVSTEFTVEEVVSSWETLS